MMQRIFSTLFLLVWGLWFGGIMFLFFAISVLFAHSHELGASAGPVIFGVFEKYHLMLSCAGVVLCAVLLETPPQRMRRWIFALVILGCITSLITSQYLTPRITALYAAGLGNSPKFMRLHGISFGIYLVETLALLVIGVLLGGGDKPREISQSSGD
ncbi:MAG TPA: DUF4149 domain-containing protein, partial [Tepidisphaeraceae bacterium]